MEVTAKVTEAHQVARRTRGNAHAPYSNFKVGAALKVREAEMPVGGCNVENASYGASVCAERTAILSAVAAHGKFQPEFMVVSTNEATAIPPCALCLQMIAEFAPDDFEIYLGNAGGILERYTLGQLLPKAFRSFTPEPPR